jgi:hypothetical protein
VAPGVGLTAVRHWRRALIVGFVFGGLAALALLACFLIAKLVYDDHTENLVLLQRR